ncbi:MAG: hypothetical protein U9R14_02200 [Patescibacteria group bacterium]|nr:hypothetical protein [Patescibacteria group bacterium]
MSKRTILFIFLIVVLLAMVVYLIAGPIIDNQNQTIGRKQAADQNNNQQANKLVDIGLLAKTYKTEVKVILNNYLRQIQDKSILTAEYTKQIKSQLLDLKMPTEFKDLHLNLVLALDKMEDYLINGGEEKLQDSQELINQVKEEYEWLN